MLVIKRDENIIAGICCSTFGDNVVRLIARNQCRNFCCIYTTNIPDSAIFPIIYRETYHLLKLVETKNPNVPSSLRSFVTIGFYASTIILQKNKFIGTNFWEIMGLKSELVAEMRQNSEQFGCMYHDTNDET